MTATISRPTPRRDNGSRARTADPGKIDSPDSVEIPSTGFRLLRSDTLRLDAAGAVERARIHLSLPNSPTERDLDTGRVAKLTECIRSGTFLPCCWATATYNGETTRMNGRHSSTAILEAADALPEQVTIHLDHYEVFSPEGMGILFRQFDARWSSRSKQDVAGAYQGLVPELRNCDRAKAKLGIEGAAWFERVVEGLPVPSSDDLYGNLLLKKYHGFIRWLNAILSVKTPEMKKAPVIGAMYGTFITSESGSQDFWPHVAKGDLVDDSDPRSVLAAELLAIKEERRREPVKPAELYAKCIKAWNAFRYGEKIRSLNVNIKKGLPEIAP